MDEYTLYLDESKNKEQTLFTISGIIIKNSNIDNLNHGMYEAKKCIWDEEYIANNNPVLHCVELTVIKDSRCNKRFLSSYLRNHNDYLVFNAMEKNNIKNVYDATYTELSKTIKNVDCTIIGCLIDLEKIKYLYGDTLHYKEELFFEVAMQEIIENYAYFLLKNNGIGNIIYESRSNTFEFSDKSADFKMYNNFCKIKACNKGISFINQDTLKKTIRYFYSNSKKDNISGLQFADFIAYNILQIINRSENQYTEFMKKISDRIYNGGFDVNDRNFRDYFGIKKLPYDFRRIHDLETQCTRIKKSYESLKTEKNGLLKKNNLLKNDKDKLLEQNEKLKDEIKQLKEKLTSDQKSIDNSI